MDNQQVFAQAFLEELQKEAGIRSNIMSAFLGAGALTGVGNWAYKGHTGETNPPRPPTAITASAEPGKRPPPGNRPPLLLRAPGTSGAPRPSGVR